MVSAYIYSIQCVFDSRCFCLTFQTLLSTLTDAVVYFFKCYWLPLQVLMSTLQMLLSTLTGADVHLTNAVAYLYRCCCPPLQVMRSTVTDAVAYCFEKLST